MVYGHFNEKIIAKYNGSIKGINLLLLESCSAITASNTIFSPCLINIFKKDQFEATVYIYCLPQRNSFLHRFYIQNYADGVIWLLGSNVCTFQLCKQFKVSVLRKILQWLNTKRTKSAVLF